MFLFEGLCFISRKFFFSFLCVFHIYMVKLILVILLNYFLRHQVRLYPIQFSLYHQPEIYHNIKYYLAYLFLRVPFFFLVLYRILILSSHGVKLKKRLSILKTLYIVTFCIKQRKVASIISYFLLPLFLEITQCRPTL